MTFRISAPEKFVFTISAPDFDQICQATCQEAVRLLVREKDSDEILDLGEADANAAARRRSASSLDAVRAEVVRVVLTHVMPPLDFVASREARRLATLQRAEELEQHALALLRQNDREELTRATIEGRRHAIELEAKNEVARLERLEERIRAVPQRDALGRRDDAAGRRPVARANTRAMVQVGPGADVAAALLEPHAARERGPAGAGRGPRGGRARRRPRRRPVRPGRSASGAIPRRRRRGRRAAGRSIAYSTLKPRLVDGSSA